MYSVSCDDLETVRCGALLTCCCELAMQSIAATLLFLSTSGDRLVLSYVILILNLCMRPSQPSRAAMKGLTGTGMAGLVVASQHRAATPVNTAEKGLHLTSPVGGEGPF